MVMWRRPVVLLASRGLSSGPPPADLLHRSELPTDHFQASLPRLPVPKLDDTVRRYLNSQSVLLGPEELDYHQRSVEEFKAGPGQQLQKALIEFAKRNSHTSYITDFWFDMYLRDRRPIVLTHTPFVVFERDPNEAYNAVDVRATNMVYSSLRLLRAYKEGCLAPEVFHLNAAKSDTTTFRRAVRWCPNRVATYMAYLFKAYPLDMSQFVNLFASTRVPRPEKDVLERFPDSKHMVILRNGHLYSFDVLDASGRALPPEQLLANFRHILALPPDPAPHPLGALTSLDRDTWTELRARLEDLKNGELLRRVDSALFVVCLDSSDLKDDTIKMMRSFLYGHTPNRWFDKSINLLFDGSGEAGLIFEHSWGDGVAVLRYVNEVHKDATSAPQVHPHTEIPAGVAAHVERLDFNLDDAMRKSISAAQEGLESKADTLDLNFRQFDAFGKEEVKKVKLSPDSVMQLAFQVAFHKMTGGDTAATYESCSTSAFKHGRTETVRSGTPETLAFSRMLADGSASAEELLDAMRKCSDKHNLLVKEAAMGQGWDRHLFGLRKMAELEGGPLPALFEDYFYTNINQIVLSTSTLSSPAVKVGGFAAVSFNGYGIGYGIFDDSLGCIVTAYPEIGGTSLTDFLEAFGEAVRDLHYVMIGRKP